VKAIIIEDAPEVVEAISLCFELRWPNIEIISTSHGMCGVEMVSQNNCDIVILDIGLPDIDGFEACRRIRVLSDVPIVVLTARDSEFDSVKGLELGADDYIVKPFSHVELLARIKAVLRRCEKRPHQEDEGSLRVGNLWIDFAAREVYLDGREIRLTPKEYEVLCCMAENKGQVVSHRKILDRVWGSECEDALEYVKVYIQRLRVKLGDDSSAPRLIICERGLGYRLGSDERKKPPTTPEPNFVEAAA